MELVLDVVVTVVSLAIVGSHILAVRNHFHSERTPTYAKVVAGVTVVSIIGFLWMTWAMVQPLWVQIIGVVVEILSVTVFFGAIRASRAHRLRFCFDPTLPASLVDTGPYRFVRHPFYVSYLLFWLGWTIAVWSAWGLVTVLVLLGLYILAARREESYFAASPLAEQYAAYKKRTGFFIPGFG